MENQNAEPTTENISRLETIGRLRACILPVLPDAETLWNQSDQHSVLFRGHLSADADTAFAQLRQSLAGLGYTPILRHQDGYDVVIAIRHVFQAGANRWVINLVLFLLTLCTTTVMGAWMEQYEQVGDNVGRLFQQPRLLLAGLPAALTIMGILGVHELAHYFVARRYGLDTTLPFFIPVPLGFGTFGAIIRIRTPWENRKALFDVGIAGPLAGFLVALPIFVIGMFTSPIKPIPPDAAMLGSPLLLQWIENWVEALRGVPPGYDTYLNAMSFAAWFGLVVTGFNLLPVGQLDGGHVAYAVLGPWTRYLGSLVMLILLGLGLFMWNGWFVWAAFIMLSGWQHPAPLNTLAPLGRKRKLIALLALFLLILLFTPTPM